MSYDPQPTLSAAHCLARHVHLACVGYNKYSVNTFFRNYVSRMQWRDVVRAVRWPLLSHEHWTFGTKILNFGNPAQRHCILIT